MNDNMLEIKSKILNLVENYSDINFKEKEFIPGISEVPVSGKVIGALELKNMVEASLDGWLTTGRFNEQFEKKLANFLGVKCLLTINSGSSANLIAFSTEFIKIDLKKIRFYLGYSGWSAGQLEEELKENTWLVTGADHRIVFDVHYEHCWKESLRRVGSPYDEWIHFPNDPHLN